MTRTPTQSVFGLVGRTRSQLRNQIWSGHDQNQTRTLIVRTTENPGDDTSSSSMCHRSTLTDTGLRLNTVAVAANMSR